ncbi:MAG TPA: FtsX-like permease family protein [Acidimicrobiales bacterium]|nr:FtsX-like permease family protein [Acidimicrobiales bacterium]
MLKTALRNVFAHKLRLLTTGLAVMLGVAFTTGTLVFTDTMGKTFDDLFASVYENTDAVVRAEAAFEDPSGFGDQRGRVDASLVDSVAAVDGVASAQGNTTGYAQIVDKDGEPLGNPEFGAPVFGGNWDEDEATNPFTIAAGRAPAADGEAVIDRQSATDAGFEPGDRATVLVQGGPIEVTVTGIVTFGSADSPGGASVVLFPLETAQRLVGEPGMFDEIAVVAEDGISQEEIAQRVEAGLPDGVEAVTGATVTEETQDAINNGLSFINTFLLVFAVIALLVGAFIIFNTFFITVAQRTRENALLRALGATKRQVLMAVLVEALAVGLVASAVGVAAGLAVAAGLKVLLDAFGISLPAGGIVVTSSTIVTGLVAGVVVTLVAAISPARKAGKVPPVAAMRDVAVSSTGYGSKQRVIVGLVILLAGVGALLYGLFGNVDNALPVVGLGALITLFAVTVLGRTVSLPLSRVISWPLARLRGITGGLASENAKRNPKRTAATASALMIGVGLVAFITIFASSFKASVDATVSETFTGDVIVTGPGAFGSGGLDPEVADRIADLPEVDEVGAIRGGFAEIDGDAQDVLGIDNALFDLFDVGVVSGSPDDLDATSIAVHEDVADDKGLGIGDTVPVVFRTTGAQELTVRLVYSEQQPAGDWVFPMEAWEANNAEQYDFQVFVKAADGVGPAAAAAAIEDVTVDYPGAKVLDQSEYVAEQTGFVDQILGLIYALLALAIVIALLGIGNTLALSIIERTRELGVLRAVGMTRTQLRSTIRWESVVIALQGTVLGLVVGVFFGWALVEAMADEGLNTLDIPYTTLAVVVVLAAIAGIVAAVLPARRAAKLDVLRAIVSE